MVWMQLGENVSAARTPGHAAGGVGACQRSGPTGGAAKGMPLKTVMRGVASRRARHETGRGLDRLRGGAHHQCQACGRDNLTDAFTAHPRDSMDATNRSADCAAHTAGEAERGPSVESRRRLDRPVARDLDDVGPGDAVVPGLPIGIPENPQEPEAEDRQRKDAGQAADERVGKPDPPAVDPDQPELADDAAERRALQRPERDVIGERQQEEGALLVASAGPARCTVMAIRIMSSANAASRSTNAARGSRTRSDATATAGTGSAGAATAA